MPITSRAMSLPPLNAVRAFEAVCRHGSILKAAEELNVVRGAVRQQIATLENHLGRKLFTRDGRRLVPTVQASAFAAAAGMKRLARLRALLDLVIERLAR